MRFRPHPLLIKPTIFTGVVAMLGVAMVGAPGSREPVLAATATPPSLSFHTELRVGYVDPKAEGSGPSQTFTARVLARGNQARVESSFGDRPIVLLFNPPYYYKLFPSSQTGVRARAGDALWSGLQSGDFEVRALITRPGAVRDLLLKAGARSAGGGKLNGVAVDAYTVSKLLGRPGSYKVWLRHADSFPLRLTGKTGRYAIAMSWRDYNRKPLTSNLFEVPSGFRIRDARRD